MLHGFLNKIFPSVKFNGKFTSVFAVFIMVVCMSHFYPPASKTPDEVDRYYNEQLQAFKKKISTFKIACGKKDPVTKLKQEFYQCRIAYKKLAVLSEYFNPYETKQLNGPPIDRIESEVADRIIPPQGLQAIEALVFDPQWTPISNARVLALLTDILSVITWLEKEPDRAFKFRDEMVWDAIRSSTVQLMTTSITGFDSPVAAYSLPEARATITSMKNLLLLFKSGLDKKDPRLLTRLTGSLGKALLYLQQHNHFNSFNRLSFITEYLDPFYRLLQQSRLKAGITVPEGRSAINYNARSLFDSGVLTVHFYSPPSDYWMTPERIRLGKLLFSDPILSGTNTRSCASCHQPAKGFSDGLVKPYALDDKTLLARNTPTLWNSGLQTKQFYDSRTDILENQLGEVVHNAEEMQGSLLNSVKHLQSSPVYKSLFDAAYPRDKNPITTFTIANAISSYVRSLQSFNSRFDQYVRGNKTKLSAAEKNGFNLFTGKAKCATCHFLPVFNGTIPPFYVETESEVLGVPKTKDKKNAVLDDDPGKFNFTHSDIHKYAFKTPSIRNVELTAPYMHNGVFDSLEEVMEFYNNGGGKGLGIAPPNQTLPFEKLSLSKKEIRDIIAFMRSLTDTSSLR